MVSFGSVKSLLRILKVKTKDLILIQELCDKSFQISSLDAMRTWLLGHRRRAVCRLRAANGLVTQIHDSSAKIFNGHPLAINS
jgi:hypothetical protein